MTNNNRRGGGESYNEKRAREQQQLAVMQPPRLPMPKEAEQQGYTIARWRAMTDAVFPSAKSVAGVMLAIDYCKARNLDPFKRPVHVVPMWSTALGREVETVWPGIGELRTTASRTGVWAGNDDIVFGRILRSKFADTRSTPGRNNGEPRVTTASCPEMEFPEYAQMTVYKIVAGVRVPFVGPKVFFVETFSGEKGLRVPNARWRQAPRGMLEKCAEAAALRRAFPEELAGELTAEEMAGQVLQADSAVQAIYSEVNTDAGDAGGGDQAQGGQQQGGGAEPEDERDLNGWHPKRLHAYMESMRKGLPTIETLADLEHVLEVDADKIASLPAEEAKEAEDLIAIERERLEKLPVQQDNGLATDEARDERDHSDEPPIDDNQADDDREDDEPQGDGTTDGTDEGTPATEEQDEEEPPFVRNFRRRVAEVELVVDLAALERSEKRAIDAQPGGVARACDRIIAERRAALKG